FGAVAEDSSGAEVVCFICWFPQVCRLIRIAVLFGLLGTKPRFAQRSIKYARKERITGQGGHGAAAHPVLSSAWMFGGKYYGPSGDLGLINWRHRLGLFWQPR